MGISSAESEDWIGEQELPYFEVYASNWLTVQVFIAMSKQWIWTGGMESRRDGLLYQSLDRVYEGLEVRRRDRPKVFRGLQAMEHAALAELAQINRPA